MGEERGERCTPWLWPWWPRMQASKRPAPQGAVAQLQALAFKPRAATAATLADGVGPTAGFVPPAAAPPEPRLNVVKAMTLKLKETYRKTDPSRPEAVDAAPRRVLTQPSFPVSNGCAAPRCPASQLAALPRLRTIARHAPSVVGVPMVLVHLRGACWP